MKKTKLNPISSQMIEMSGWNEEYWHSNYPHISGEYLYISKGEYDRYLGIASKIYNKLISLIPNIMESGKYVELGIPHALIDMIRHSLDRKDIHLYSRMDLYGGLGNVPIKFIEINPQTATLLPESLIFQSIQVEDNSLGSKQGDIHDLGYARLVEAFESIMDTYPDYEPNFLFTGMIDASEEERINLTVLMSAAADAGFNCDLVNINSVIFDKNGVFTQTEKEDEYIKWPFVFSLVPYEVFALEEPETFNILRECFLNNEVILMNPPYSLLFQSKYILKILWDEYRDDFSISPYLLECDTLPLIGKKHVCKPNFGRGGEGVSVYSKDLNLEMGTQNNMEGDFVYQEYAEPIKDSEGNIYQAGVFVINGTACSISFRKDKDYIKEGSEFVGFLID